jgi:sarcosine oxidase delta subunit
MTDLEACKQLLARLKKFEFVTARELRRALGEEHWQDYEGRREWVKALRERAKIASYELRNYVQMLRIADLQDAQPNRNISLRRERKRGLHWTSPDRKYERALEHLSEKIAENGSLARHLDRFFTPYRWDSTSDIGPDKQSVPRLWYTKNALPQPEEGQIKSIRQLRKEALERAIAAMSTPPAAPKKRNLRRLPLRKPRKSS